MATAVYWSGGKDCTLALLEYLHVGISIDYLITFVGENTKFLCHPMSIMKEQAKQLGIRHILHVVGEPYMSSYARAISDHKRDFGINAVITGDLIHEESGKFERYWLRKLCEQSGVKLMCPMGSISRKEVLEKVLSESLRAYISGVHTGVLPIDLLWHCLDEGKIEHLQRLNQNGHSFDLCGENGEYHTTVLSSRLFSVSMPALGEFAGRCYQVAYLPLLDSGKV